MINDINIAMIYDFNTDLSHICKSRHVLLEKRTRSSFLTSDSTKDNRVDQVALKEALFISHLFKKQIIFGLQS